MRVAPPPAKPEPNEAEHLRRVVVGLRRVRLFAQADAVESVERRAAWVDDVRDRLAVAVTMLRNERSAAEILAALGET